MRGIKKLDQKTFRKVCQSKTGVLDYSCYIATQLFGREETKITVRWYFTQKFGEEFINYRLHIVDKIPSISN